MTEPPLDIRRRSTPPGFARRPAETPSEAPAAETPTPDETAAASEPEPAPANNARRTPRTRPPGTRSRGRARHADPEAPAALPPAAAESYAGAGSVQFNVRLLAPLHERYARLVRRLADEGFKTTSTELVHALLHEGPDDPEAARELVRRWRRTRAED